jgi:hypothetical protein
MSLTSSAYQTRILIKFSGVILGVFTILYFGAVAAIKAYQAAHPPYIPPTVRYGLLPPIVFPEKKYTAKNFSIEFPNDAPPKTKDQAKVYVVFRPDNGVMALAQDTITAKNLGFTNDPAKISEGIYEFRNNNLNLTLTMNVVEGSFKLSYPYLSDQTLLNSERIPDKEEAIKTAINYLSQAGKMPKDMEKGEKKVSYWNIDSSGLRAAKSQSEANIARVDFFREDLEGGFKIVSTSYSEAPVSVLVTGATGQGRNVVEVNYKYADIDREAYSTYPIKSAEQAVSELKSGNYWPVFDVASDSVVIRKVELMYLEPFTLTNYMQPIYVFEGDNGFVAYVPAITDKFVNKSN